MKKTWSVLIAAGWILVAVTGAAEPDLSPASWPPGELEKYDGFLQSSARAHPRGTGRRGLVVGTTGAPAVRAGLEALRQGGSAADAAIVTSLAQITLAAGCWVSFAGKYVMVYYDAATGRVYSLDAGFNTVLGEADPESIPPFGTPSGRTALVPGFMAGLEAGHRRFGKLPWAELFAPAIYYAEEGFEIYPLLGSSLSFRESVLRRLPATRAVFTDPDTNRFYRTGDHFRQPALAATLRRVAELGAQEMYRGLWARKFVEAVRAEGGRMAMDDLRGYEVIWPEPARGSYRNFEITGPGAPATGGGYVIDTLRRLEPYDLRGLGHYSESAEALYRLLTATRDLHLARRSGGNHSDGVIAIDREGNVAAVLHTINTDTWGTTGLFVDGVSIPDVGAWTQGQIAEVGPGGRLPTPANPLIVLRRGEPWVVSSAIGSGLFDATIQGLVNILDYRLDPKKAVDMPYFRNPDIDEPSDPSEVTLGDFPASLIEDIRVRGIPIRSVLRRSAVGQGYWIDAVIYRTGRRMGATTNDFNGFALGY